MKRMCILALIASFSTTLLADHWTAKTVYDYPNECALFVKVTVNGLDPQETPNLEVAAFIDGDCRAQATTPGTGNRYTLRVVGEYLSEEGHDITFKAAYKGLTYSFTATRKFLQNGGLFDLTLDPVTGVSLPALISREPTTLPTEIALSEEVTLTYTGGTPTGTSIVDPGQLTYVWDAGNSAAYFTVDNLTNILTSTTLETPDEGMPLLLSAIGPEYLGDAGPEHLDFPAATMVKIQKAVIPVTGITLTPTSITMQVGDIVSEKLAQVIVNVAPVEATNPTYAWSGNPQEDAWYAMNNMQELEVTTPGTWTIIYSSVSNPEVTALLTVTVPTPVSFLIPDDVTLSKFRDVTVNFSNFQGDNFDVNLIQFNPIIRPYNNDTPFKATRLTDDGMSWSLRGKYVGNWTFEVTYDGKRMMTESGSDLASALVDAEVVLPDANWDWITFNYVPESGVPFPITTWENVNIDVVNRITEVRSQTGLLYNDPTEGFFGDITHFDPAVGMYKVCAYYYDEEDGYNIINLGPYAIPLSEAGLGGDGLLHVGYTWIPYPFEFDLELEELPSLTYAPADGDMIIAPTSMAVFDGYDHQWVTGDDFKFRAGKGYIYFTEEENISYPDFSFKGIPLCYQETPAPVKGEFMQDFRFTEQREGFADNMPVIARIEGLSNPEQYVLGAFVGDECRGQGRLGVRDIMLLSVSGKSGEKVHFRLMNTFTGETSEVNEIVPYASRRGSLKAPLQLTTELVTGIRAPKVLKADESDIYNLAGQRLTAPRKGINIINGKKVLY